MSLLLPIDPNEPDMRALSLAASALRSGGVVAYPTETLYGLGVDPFREEALERLYALKGRPADMPVSVLVRDTAMLEQVACALPEAARRLIRAFLPGPLTLVLRARPGLPARLTSGTEKVGVRISAHPLMKHLFSAYPAPVTTTSANPTGRPDARDAREVLRYFPEGLDCILDAGPVTGGIGSTVVDVTGDDALILRPGAVSEEEIARALR
jgi:L-threonylcarbamoyladenylate synthase